MSDTPRTDRAANESIVRVYETSKQLEIELSNALHIQRLLESELAEVIAQRHEALEALEGLIENYKLNNGRGFGIGPRVKAKAAIAKLKGQNHE